jgi:glycosyltransferase involved in cell wall biosynthesis
MIAPTSFFADYGCHVRILEEVRELQRLGNLVTVCTYHNGSDVPGVDIRRSLDVPWRKGVQVGSSRHKLYFDIMLAAKAWRVANQVRPHLIHSHIHEGALIGWPISRALGIPLVFDFQGSMTSEMVDHRFLSGKDSWAYRPLFWLEGRIDLMPEAVITSSENAANLLARSFRTPINRVYTVCDRVDTRRFRPVDDGFRGEVEDLRRRLGIPEDRRVVVYLGLLAKYQGTDVLLQAARILSQQMPNVHFLVMGYPGADSYGRQAESMGLASHTSFTGRIPYDEAHLYLGLGDVAVSPKMSATEGNGKLSNYMAMGLPIVVFDSPINREILGELGVYAAFGSAESLAESIRWSLTRRKKSAELGRRGREKATQELSWESGGAELMRIYDRVTSQRLANRG